MHLLANFLTLAIYLSLCFLNFHASKSIILHGSLQMFFLKILFIARFFKRHLYLLYIICVSDLRLRILLGMCIKLCLILRSRSLQEHRIPINLIQIGSRCGRRHQAILIRIGHIIRRLGTGQVLDYLFWVLLTRRLDDLRFLTKGV